MPLEPSTDTITVEKIANVFKEMMDTLHKYRQDLEETSLMLEANLEEISNTYDLLSSLLEITNVLSKSINPFDVAKDVVDIISKNIPSEEVALFIINDGEIKNFSNSEPKRSREFFNSYILTSNAKIVIEERIPLIAVPVEGEGFQGAFVCVGKKNGSFYTAADRKLIEAAAKQLKISLSNYRYFRLELERTALQRELSIAYQIQQSLFPKNFPNEFEVAGISIPAHDVGGDYYDAFEIDGKLFFTVADVSGKGVSAAIIMSAFRSYLKGTSRMEKDLKNIAISLNRLISSDIPEDRFVTAVLGILDPENQTFEYVSAGHNPMLLLREDRIDQLESNGIPFGIYGVSGGYDVKKIHVEKGDIIVAYTDGIVEARSVEKCEYGLSRFIDVLKELRDFSPSDILGALITDVQNFSKGADQHDDVTTLIAKV